MTMAAEGMLLSPAQADELMSRLDRIETLLATRKASPGGLLKTEDVAARLKRSRRYVERLVKAGRLKKVPNLGARTTRFRAVDVERLIAERDNQVGRRNL